MNEKELGFLEKQFKQLGLKDEFSRELVEALNQQPQAYQHVFTRNVDGNDVKSVLHLSKSDQSNLYFINRQEMHVTRHDLHGQKEGAQNVISQNFSVHKDNKYTFKESYNMLMGRAVYTSHTNKMGEQYNAWSKINWSNKLGNGNFEISQYNENYGFNLENVLAKYPIKELSNEKFKDSLISSLERGNLQSVTFVGKNGEEEKMFIAPNISLGILNVYDADKQKLTTGVLVEKNYIGQELADELKLRLEKLGPKQDNVSASLKIDPPPKETLAKEQMPRMEAKNVTKEERTTHQAETPAKQLTKEARLSQKPLKHNAKLR